jgi:uncharacterized protein
MSPAPGQPPDERQAHMWNMWCHLSALAGLAVPFGNIIGPLVVWQMKKNEFPSVDEHGRNALNFQISVSIVVLCGIALAFALSFVCVGFLLIPVVILAHFAGLVLSAIAGIKANDGKAYRYPWSLHLVN